MCLQLTRSRHGALLGKCHGIAHLPLDLALDRLARCNPDHGADTSDRIGRLPRPELRSGTVPGIKICIGSDVLTPAIGRALDEAWTVRSRAHGRNGARRRGADRHNVRAVDPRRWQAECAYLGDEVAHGP